MAFEPWIKTSSFYLISDLNNSNKTQINAPNDGCFYSVKTVCLMWINTKCVYTIQDQF